MRQTITIGLLLTLVGCSQSSYQDCVDFQTAAAKRDFANPMSTSYKKFQTEQDFIDQRVTIQCREVGK